ncbi:MAG TPA: Maf family protein [Ktedonobacteraceae bacterium]|jgi:MAF protein
MIMTQSPLLLASASPRRRQLIKQLGLPVELVVAPIDEDALQAHYQGSVEQFAEWTARHKAVAALDLPEARGRLVIGADTTVVLDDEILGKPRDPAHAYELLAKLRGRWHKVITAVVVAGLQDNELQVVSESCSTPVLMRPYSDAEVEAYIATGDPLDKAGAYGIQHPQFQPTERIAGCYLNVVGLPLCTLTRLLAQFNCAPDAPDHPERACRWSERCLI